MINVVAAVIERSDRRLLIGQRRKNDTSPLKWNFRAEKSEKANHRKPRSHGNYRKNSV